MKTAVSQSRRVSKSVKVSTTAPGAESVRLRFTVDVRMPIEARPSLRFSLNAIEGTSFSQRILLSRADGEALAIAEPRVVLEGVSATVLPVDPAARNPAAKPGESRNPRDARARPVTPKDGKPGDVWLELKTTTSLAAGRYSDLLSLTTNDPEAPTLKVPFTIRVRPLIDARPDVVRMWTAPDPATTGRSQVVTFLHSGNRPFEISSIEVSHPEIFDATTYENRSSIQQSVRVGLIEEIDAGAVGAGIDGWMRITTDDPDRPVIEVPVLVGATPQGNRRPVTRRR